MVLSAPFPKYGDLLATNCLFFLPLSHLTPSLPAFPLAFRGEVSHEETRVVGLSYSEDRDRSSSRFDTVPACDRRTDGQTDGFAIASYADAL